MQTNQKERCLFEYEYVVAFNVNDFEDDGYDKFFAKDGRGNYVNTRVQKAWEIFKELKRNQTA